MPREKFAHVALTLGILSSTILAHAGAIPHRWSNAAKQVVGTSVSGRQSPVWFTMSSGIINEVYYPTVDQAQVGDTQLLFTRNEESRLIEEKRDCKFTFAYARGKAQNYEIPLPHPILKGECATSDEPIRFIKEVVTDPKWPVVRIRYQFASLPDHTTVYVLHKPTVGNDGAGDTGQIFREKSAFIAWDGNVAQGFFVSDKTPQASVGIVGEDDGWQQLNRAGKLTALAERAGPGSIAYTAAVDMKDPQLEILIAFDATPKGVANVAKNTLARNFNDVAREYDTLWQKYASDRVAASAWLSALPADLVSEILWSAIVVKTHEDKQNPGAIIASLSIPSIPTRTPTGAADGKLTGGYHLIWPRDLFKSALGLLRLGDVETAANALRFMARMEHNGRMSQNAWTNGNAFWTGVQLDQEAFPVILDAELRRVGAGVPALKEFISRRVQRLKDSGGLTDQDRWEEAGGYSPNTLAVIAAAFAAIGDKTAATKALNTALEKSVSRKGPLSEKPYFIRISRTGDPDSGEMLTIANEGPTLPANRVLDGGFLEWVRWFHSPIEYFGAAQGLQLVQTVASTLRLYDDGFMRMIGGIPLYRRYTGDAYGIGHHGGYWPILTLERAVLAVEQNPDSALTALRQVRSLQGEGGLCPEQLDENLKPMPFAANPLVWCHAEMIELGHRYVSRVRSKVR